MLCEILSQFLLTHFCFDSLDKRLAFASPANNILQLLYPLIGIADLLFDFLFRFTAGVIEGFLKGLQKLNQVVFLLNRHVKSVVP